MEWISVGDRFPKNKQIVVVWRLSTQHYDIAWFGREEGFLIDGGSVNGEVTHWHPLPAPPTEQP